MPDTSDWTVTTLMQHYDALREADRALAEERDRRYAQVSSEREKALKIKETADLAALQLARDIQTYKDEKANELREQISSERGLYATQADLAALSKEITAMIRPLVDYTSAQRGGGRALGQTFSYLIAAAAVAVAIVTLLTRA